MMQYDGDLDLPRRFLVEPPAIDRTMGELLAAGQELLVAKGIPQKAQRWYVTHVEQFLGAVQPNSLKGLTTDDITGYLRQTSSQGKWQEWQFRQMVDALQLLLVDLAGVKAAGLVLGARVPIVLSGPGDTEGTLTASCALAALLWHAQARKASVEKPVRPIPSH